eukprot:scaffold238404_cov30-Tisochrysis_lutea.AAC.3
MPNERWHKVLPELHDLFAISRVESPEHLGLDMLLYFPPDRTPWRLLSLPPLPQLLLHLLDCAVIPHVPEVLEDHQVDLLLNGRTLIECGVLVRWRLRLRGPTARRRAGVGAASRHWHPAGGAERGGGARLGWR